MVFAVVGVCGGDVGVGGLGDGQDGRADAQASALQLEPVVDLRRVGYLVHAARVVDVADLLALAVAGELSDAVELDAVPVLAAACEGSFGGDAGGGHAPGGEFSGVEVPLVVAGGIGELACVYGVGVDAVAVGERAEVPVSVRLLAVGDAPVSASDVDALGGVLVFGLVVHVDALAGFEVRVSAGGVHDLVDAVDEDGFCIGNVNEGITKPELVDEFKLCNVYAKDKCKDCFARFYCSGGCAANSYKFHGNILDAYDIGCELQKKRIECAIMIKAALADEEENQ